MLEKHCNFVSTDKLGVTCQLATLNTELENTKTKVDLLDITWTCEAVPVLCDEITGKLDYVKRAMDTTLLSMEQSVDHAAQKVSLIEKFPLDSLEELISKVDDAVRNLAVSEYSSQSHAEVMKELK